MENLSKLIFLGAGNERTRKEFPLFHRIPIFAGFLHNYAPRLKMAPVLEARVKFTQSNFQTLRNYRVYEERGNGRVKRDSGAGSRTTGPVCQKRGQQKRKGETLLRVLEVFKNRITLNRMPVLNDWEDSELQSRLAEATYFNAESTRAKGALNDFKL